MSELGFEIEIKGKLFNPLVDKKLVIAMNQGVANMALAGEARVKGQLIPYKKVYITGHLHGSIAGNLVKDLVAQVDAGAVKRGANTVYASWIEGTSSRNRTTKFKGYHMFRNARVFLDNEPKDKYFAEPVRKAIGT